MGMESLNDMFFTSAGKEALTYDQILEDVQKYCTEKHADKLSGEVILSRLVDTFSSRILYPMLLLSGNHSIAAVLSWEEDLH